MSGRLIGVGTGPGDPGLLTVKAVRALGDADVVAWFAKAGRRGNARATVEGLFRADAVELPLPYPVTTEIPVADPRYGAAITGFFVEAAAAVEAHLAEGRTVAVLSEGDPLFYGSYMHLHVRLAPRYPAEVIPGITAMSGCWSQAGLPLVQGDDVLSVLPGTLPEAELTRRLIDSPASVIMKVGRNLATIRRALAGAGKLGRAVYVERGTMEQSQMTPLAAKPDDVAPYFSLVLVPGWEDRP
ncbi:precorrin-2/cobalt-factor-2 C20-methyltransferase [Amaricoccus macauensis]|uniref:Precorrin-2/cobalt-factor-2 C20-methyltransferase n=1 Tax=Amaricoccus macauensis TaxID=57001 RepID=A0A840STD7_9RHOB|nr:precorrin-2 C(20)-methyltransferase [Amaricoccus macauensis]MBB5224030.1 precorrin-2/cobalt-factor-2 C20-methyltransferase [Amaricoccus macauensis]